MNRYLQSLKSRKGFTLVELAVVVVIIGVLAAFGVPKFLNSVERSKASEAFAYLSAIRTAEERYLARQGVYTETVADLDIAVQPPKYFGIGVITVVPGSDTADPSWTMTLTRIAGSSSKGDYTVIFTQDGYDTSSTIESHPEINPSGTTTTGTTTGS
jgi:prepilin-type N-terminal cleavage/methylation domain-containing protein